MALRVSKPLFMTLGALSILALTGCHSSSNAGDSPWYETNAVAVADLNGDARSDVICVDAWYGSGPPHPGFLSIRLQGSSPGTYADPIRTDTGQDPVAVAVAYMDSDSLPDLVLANHQASSGALGNNYITVCYQSGTVAGSFPVQTRLYVGARNPVDVATADLDGDGRQDVVVAAEGASNVLVFYQTAPGVFSTTPVSIAVSGEPAAVCTAQLRGSNWDIVAATSTGVSVLLNNGGGSFASAVSYATGSTPVAVRVADLGNGHPDVVTANWNALGTGVSLLLGDGTGAFAAAVSFDTGDNYAASIAIGTIGSDTAPSILVANYGAAGYSGSVAVLRPDTTPGTFLTPEMYMGYYGPLSVALADLNGDGMLDMVVADGATLVRYQDPGNPGHFQPPVQLRN